MEIFTENEYMSNEVKQLLDSVDTSYIKLEPQPTKQCTNRKELRAMTKQQRIARRNNRSK